MDTQEHLLSIECGFFFNSKYTDTKTTNQITTQPIQKHSTNRLLYLGPMSMQIQHEISNFFCKKYKGKNQIFKLKSFFLVKEGQALPHWRPMWSIILIGFAAATTLMRLPEIF